MPRTKGQEMIDAWLQHAIEHLQGRTIVNVRYQNDVEKDAYGWQERALVLVLDDGSTIYPSCDSEGNQAGSLFGHNLGWQEAETTFPSVPGWL